MDDFGTGYSSLGYLRSFPFDRIKIDQSFIRDLGSDKDSLGILRAVVGLGRSLGMVTTAEGVETSKQLEVLRSEGCTDAQGFLFSQPRTQAEITDFLGSLRASGQSRSVRQQSSALPTPQRSKNSATLRTCAEPQVQCRPKIERSSAGSSAAESGRDWMGRALASAIRPCKLWIFLMQAYGSSSRLLTDHFQNIRAFDISECWRRPTRRVSGGGAEWRSAQNFHSGSSIESNARNRKNNVRRVGKLLRGRTFQPKDVDRKRVYFKAEALAGFGTRPWGGDLGFSQNFTFANALTLAPGISTSSLV